MWRDACRGYWNLCRRDDCQGLAGSGPRNHCAADLRRRRIVCGRTQDRLRGRCARERRLFRKRHGDRARRRLRSLRRGPHQRYGGSRRGLRRHLRRRPRACRSGRRSCCSRGRRASRPLRRRRRQRHRHRRRDHVSHEPRRAPGDAQSVLSSDRDLRRARCSRRRRRCARPRAGPDRAGRRHRRKSGVGHHRVSCGRQLHQAVACRCCGPIGDPRGTARGKRVHRPRHGAGRPARLLSRVRAVEDAGFRAADGRTWARAGFSRPSHSSRTRAEP